MGSKMLSSFLVLLSCLLLTCHGRPGTQQMSSSYSCSTEDQCDESDMGFPTEVSGVRYCCKSSDAITLHIQGPGFSYSSSIYAGGWETTETNDTDSEGNETSTVEDRDTSSVIEAPEGRSTNTTITCTCNAVDLEKMENELVDKINDMRQEFRDQMSDMERMFGDIYDFFKRK